MLTPACTHCSDTGSTQKRLDCDFLDCTHCGVASERMALEAWAADAAGVVHGGVAALWLIYQHGKAVGAAPLLEVLKAFPGFTDDATVGDPWLEQRTAAITAATRSGA